MGDDRAARDGASDRVERYLSVRDLGSSGDLISERTRVVPGGSPDNPAYEVAPLTVADLQAVLDELYEHRRRAK